MWLGGWGGGREGEGDLRQDVLKDVNIQMKYKHLSDDISSFKRLNVVRDFSLFFSTLKFNENLMS